MVLIKVEDIEVWGFEHAIRGLRNPMNSWDKSDSHHCNWEISESCDKCGKLDSDNTGMCESDREFNCIGKNDLDLMRRLFKAGTEHRKYLRQIFVSMDIVAPLYWWKEFSTYKVGTVENSCSTMHKIAAKDFTLDDFSHEHLTAETSSLWVNADKRDFMCSALDFCQITCDVLNHYRELYLETKDKKYWWQMIQLLPTSYNQRRTITMNYENVFTIIKQRTGHKLDEWNEFVKVLKTLPYVKEIGGY
jgi:hypothetical protein